MSEVRLEQIDFVLGEQGYHEVSGEPDQLRGLYAPQVDYDELVKRFEEGNETYAVKKGPSGRSYETVMFNSDKAAQALIVKPSTSYSSVFKNPANFLETSLAAAANPEAAYMYVGSFSNRPTGRMSPADRSYISHTGRYTTGNNQNGAPYRALESVEDMGSVIEGVKTDGLYFTADSEAGRLALGLMAGLSKDTVKGTYLNGVDGISPAAHYVEAKLLEDLRSRIYRRGIGKGEVGELTPVNIKDVKKRADRIYSGLGRIAHIAPLPVFLFPTSSWDKVWLTKGFHGNDDLDDPDNHAVFQDMRAALLRQDATITLQFNKKSAIDNLEDCRRFGRMIMDSLPQGMRDERRRVRLLIGEGEHDEHTDKPHDRTRIERYVFRDIMHSMSAVDGLTVGSRIFDLKPIEQAA